MAEFIIVPKELLFHSQTVENATLYTHTIKSLLSFSEDNREEDLSVLNGKYKPIIIQGNYKPVRTYSPFTNLYC